MAHHHRHKHDVEGVEKVHSLDLICEEVGVIGQGKASGGTVLKALDDS